MKKADIDSREILPCIICDTLRKKEIMPESIVGQRLVIWLNCDENVVFDNYDCESYRDEVWSHLYNNGGYEFGQVTFKQGEPNENSGASKIGDNDKEWFTTELYTRPEIVPIQASVCAGEGFKLKEEKYTLSADNHNYNIGRGEHPKRYEDENRTNQIVFDEEYERNRTISGNLAHIKYLGPLNRFIFEPDEGGNNKIKRVGIQRRGKKLYGGVLLETGDQIIVDDKSIILVYTEQSDLINSNKRPNGRNTHNHTNQVNGNDPHRDQTGNITLKVLKKKLVCEFKQCLKSESDFKEGSLLFPVSFNILMTPDDFQDRRALFEDWLPVILSALYDTIRKQKQLLEIFPKSLNKIRNIGRTCWAKANKKVCVPKEYISRVTYMPKQGQWFFQFLSCDTDRNINRIQDGKPVIYYSYAVPNENVEENEPRYVKGGILTEVTKGKKIKFYEDELAEINIAGQVSYSRPFDEQLPTNQRLIRMAISDYKPAFAKIKFPEGNLEWEMRTPYVEISGREDVREQIDVIKIPNSGVQQTHIAIRYSKEKKKFELAVWGNTKLNGNEISKSTGTNPIWVLLPGESTLVLNNDAVVRFEANPKFL